MRWIEDKKKNKLHEMLGDLCTTAKGKSYLAKWKGFHVWGECYISKLNCEGIQEDIYVFVVPQRTLS